MLPSLPYPVLPLVLYDTVHMHNMSRMSAYAWQAHVQKQASSVSKK